MIIEHAQRSNTVNQFKGFNCVCIAENGFSMINQYAGHFYGVSHEVIREFCDSVNRRNEMGIFISFGTRECFTQSFCP